MPLVVTNDLNRVSSRMQSALFRQMIILLSTLVCLIFTGMCGMQHLQRGGERQFDLFTSFYFVIVTFSTVGYGDCYPDTWMSRLFVVILICAAIGILPSQIEALGQTWLARQKAGGEYTEGWAKNEKHVVVTITHLEAEFIQDFLTEFFAHPEHQVFCTSQISLHSATTKKISSTLIVSISLCSQLSIIYVELNYPVQ
ncbi:unnamed protein product [Toxocara canis]|uniref:Ion_trans_2 domain-containing protein n=1 Tax=Toxocara canis TaxID=6265 RepID=A0A183VCL5_TOXCA|nr:unnamed protein product [Toxocara canis]